MPIEWCESLELREPVVDSEHRYLVQLINNLHEKFEAGIQADNLAKVFSHLLNYVRVHFENEEALMEAINYPDISEHRKKHQELMDQALELSDLYMEREKDITIDTLEFLDKWVVGHIAGFDMKIKEFLKGERPPSITTTPAYANQSTKSFKTCTFCGKNWDTFDELKKDGDKEVKGIQADMTNHLYNLILFNCSCGTTLALMVKELVTIIEIPFEIEEHDDNTDNQPDYCLKTKEGAECLARCICKYSKQIVEILN